MFSTGDGIKRWVSFTDQKSIFKWVKMDEPLILSESE